VRIAFLHSDKPREGLLADAFLSGARVHGHDTSAIPLGQDPEPGAHDIVCMVGVKSRERFQAYHRAGAHVIYLDKGYSRHKRKGPIAGWEYWRVAIDAHHPTALIASQDSPSDRALSFGWSCKPWADHSDGPIVIAGSSLKYCEFYGLPHPTQYASEIVAELRRITKRPIIYRPKPSWRDAVPIKRAKYSEAPETFDDLLQSAFVVITHGSNACFDAVMGGVPCVVLGDGVARPISATALADVEQPKRASDVERFQWAANLAYWQWTLAEMASGEAWAFLGGKLHAV
jgi:hypothetical protein